MQFLAVEKFSTKNIFAQALPSFKAFCPSLHKSSEPLTCPLVKRSHSQLTDISSVDTKRVKAEPQGAIINQTRKKLFSPEV